jgi:N-acetylglucosamine-6-phosphate deacetylase
VTQLKGNLVTPLGISHGTLSFSSLIETISPSAKAKDDIYILPGFIDTHVHGGGGGDTMDGPDGVLKLANFHMQHGTTTLYPTTMTNPWQNILKALHGVRQVMGLEDTLFPNSQLPAIPGVHLEGPFISPKRLGAQPPFTLESTKDLLEELLGDELAGPDIIRLVTLAPEMPGALAAATCFVKAKVRVSIGHSAATYEQARALMQAVQTMHGTLGFTHLYNAMTGLAGREPGVVGAALADKNSFAELILDTHHVHPASFLAALQAKPNHLFLITDCIRAGGLPDGPTELGGQAVMVKEGKATLQDGTLAGSVLTLDVALRNALNAGLNLEAVSQLLSKTPARYMGLEDRGTLELGKRADLVILDKDMKVQGVYVAGKKSVG